MRIAHAYAAASAPMSLDSSISITMAISFPRPIVIVAVLLQTKAYKFGTRHYQSPDWLFYTLTDLCAKRPSDPALQEMRDLLDLRIRDRLGCDKDIFNAAMRLLRAQALGIVNARDLDTILEAQLVDGGWERVWLWRYGSEALKIGSRAVVAAMAIEGIQTARSLSWTA